MALDFPASVTLDTSFAPNADGAAWIGDGSKWRKRGFTTIFRTTGPLVSPTLSYYALMLPTQFKMFLINIVGLLPTTDLDVITLYLSQNSGSTWLSDLRYCVLYGINSGPAYNKYDDGAANRANIPYLPYAPHNTQYHPMFLRMWIKPGSAGGYCSVMFNASGYNSPNAGGPMMTMGFGRTQTLGRVNAISFSNATAARPIYCESCELIGLL